MSESPPRIELTVPRTTQYLAMVRKVVAMAAERTEFPRGEVDLIELAIDEACSNAVIHGANGPPEIRVEVEVTEQRFTVILRDGGPRYPFDKKGNFEVEEQLGSEEVGGLGIYIIKRFMDEVAYTYTPDAGSVIAMTKLREVPATA